MAKTSISQGSTLPPFGRLDAGVGRGVASRSADSHLECLPGGTPSPSRPPRNRYTCPYGKDIVRIRVPGARSVLRPGAGTQTDPASRPAHRGRHAAHAGAQGAPLHPPVQFPDALAPDAFESALGRLRHQPAGRPPHRAIGHELAGGRYLRRYPQRRLCLRRQGQRAPAGCGRRFAGGHRRAAVRQGCRGGSGLRRRHRAHAPQ